jgi:hypothetical protein
LFIQVVDESSLPFLFLFYSSAIINAKRSPITVLLTGKNEFNLLRQAFLLLLLLLLSSFVFFILRQIFLYSQLTLSSSMTHTVSSANGGTSTTANSNNRPRLCRSDHQPNMLEYIDTTLNDSFSARFKIQSGATTTTTTVNGCDQFGNTTVDQYLLYILCQKLHPDRTEQLYQSLHQLLISHGQISKSFFEYSPPLTINRAHYQSLFHHYTNFIWNEFDVGILLELGQ